MGCDIHVMVEARRFPCGSNEWFNVDNWRHNPFSSYEGEPRMTVKAIYNIRDYELFSFLADVRNYGHNPSFGFDRGFPKDANEHTTAEYARWGQDAHTPGYATLAELKEKIKTVSKVNRKGFVEKEQAIRFRETGAEPDTWYQGIGMPELYEWMEWQAEPNCFDLLLEALEERKRDIFWIFRPEDDDGSNDANIRIVFWFDN
jgi:hypothetical protein